jgi:hypothetical protein
LEVVTTGGELESFHSLGASHQQPQGPIGGDSGMKAGIEPLQAIADGQEGKGIRIQLDGPAL